MAKTTIQEAARVHVEHAKAAVGLPELQDIQVANKARKKLHGSILARSRYAGYHRDIAALRALFAEAAPHKINFGSLRSAYASGASHREKGQPCGCSDCTVPAQPQAPLEITFITGPAQIAARVAAHLEMLEIAAANKGKCTWGTADSEGHTSYCLKPVVDRGSKRLCQEHVDALQIALANAGF